MKECRHAWSTHGDREDEAHTRDSSALWQRLYTDGRVARPGRSCGAAEDKAAAGDDVLSTAAAVAGTIAEAPPGGARLLGSALAAASPQLAFILSPVERNTGTCCGQPQADRQRRAPAAAEDWGRPRSTGGRLLASQHNTTSPKEWLEQLQAHRASFAAHSLRQGPRCIGRS